MNIRVSGNGSLSVIPSQSNDVRIECFLKPSDLEMVMAESETKYLFLIILFILNILSIIGYFIIGKVLSRFGGLSRQRLLLSVLGDCYVPVIPNIVVRK